MSRVAGLVGDCAAIISPVLRLHVYPNVEYPTFFFILASDFLLRFSSSSGQVSTDSNNLTSGRGNAAPPVIGYVRQIDALPNREAQTEKSSLETH